MINHDIVKDGDDKWQNIVIRKLLNERRDAVGCYYPVAVLICLK